MTKHSQLPPLKLGMSQPRPQKLPKAVLYTRNSRVIPRCEKGVSGF